MGRSGGRLLVKSAAWGLVAGVITVAACFATLNGFSHLTGFQVGWIALAGLASISYTGFSAVAASRSAATIDRVSLTVTDIDQRDKNQTMALLAKVFSMCHADLVRMLAEPDWLDEVLDGPLAALQIALCRCHGLDESRIRVSLVMHATAGLQGHNGSPTQADYSVRSVSGNHMPRFDFADQDISEQFLAVMSRRHPYKQGWLWDGLDGTAARLEYHVLSPTEREFSSYIRVGVPGLGVLCVDCSDDKFRLVTADCQLALAFADVLAIPGKVKLPLAAQLPAAQPVLRNREEAN